MFPTSWTVTLNGQHAEVTSAGTFKPAQLGATTSIFFHRDLLKTGDPTIPLFPLSRPATNVAKPRPGSAFATNVDGTDDFHLFAFTKDGTNAQTYGIQLVSINRAGGTRWMQTIDNIETIPFPDDFVQRPSVTVDRNGDGTVVYTNFLNGTIPEARGLRFDADGNFIGDSFPISTPPKAPGDVALLDPAGDRLVVVTTNFSDLVGNILDLSGPDPVVGPDFPINNTPANFGNVGPNVGVDPATGNFTVAWENLSGDQGDPVNIRARRFDADGNPVGDDFLVNTTTANAQGQVNVGAGPGGLTTIVWAGDGLEPQTDFLDVFLQVYDADGNPIGGETRANTGTANSQQWPQIDWLPEFDSQGRPQFVVGWCDLEGDGFDGTAVGTGLSYKCFSIEGLTLGGNDRDNDGLTDDEEAAIGTDPDNPDSDYDGVSDGVEVLAGYDPLSLLDAFRISSVVVDEGSGLVLITLPVSKIGKTYSLLEVDLETGVRTPVPGQQDFAGTGSDLIFTDGFESGDTTAWSVSSP